MRNHCKHQETDVNGAGAITCVQCGATVASDGPTGGPTALGLEIHDLYRQYRTPAQPCKDEAAHHARYTRRLATGLSGIAVLAIGALTFAQLRQPERPAFADPVTPQTISTTAPLPDPNHRPRPIGTNGYRVEVAREATPARDVTEVHVLTPQGQEIQLISPPAPQPTPDNPAPERTVTQIPKAACDILEAANAPLPIGLRCPGH